MKELKEFMSTATTVDEWNELRDKAKDSFSTELITELDGSGYIKEILIKE